MIALASAFVGAAVVLALGLAATVVLRRRSAALRHAILAAAIAAATVLPLLKALLPQIPVIRWSESVALVGSGPVFVPLNSASGAIAAPPAHAFPWALAAVVVWAIGALLLSAGLAASLFRLARLESRCTPASARWRELADDLSSQCGVGRRVLLLQSDEPSILVACGVRRPRIILPAGASMWGDDRRRVVLRHELAHIKRRDALTQMIAETLRIAQWVNPLVWVACHRLRQESERACDTAVLTTGLDAADYAKHLLDIARQLSGRGSAWASAHAVANPSTLERRIVAMLHHHEHRWALSTRGWSVAAVVTLAITVPLGAAGVAPAERAQATAAPARDVALAAAAPAPWPELLPHARPAARRQTTGSISGLLRDQFGGTLPGATVTLTNTDTGVQLVQQSDATGTFMFRDLQPGRYAFVAALPGFKAVTGSGQLAAGAAWNPEFVMGLGTVSETVTVACSGTSWAERLPQFASRWMDAMFPVLSAQEQSAGAVRVGGNIRMPLKLATSKPVCPSTVPDAETTVRVVGKIGVDGYLKDVSVVPTDSGVTPPDTLVTPAIDAVRQWIYSPTLLDGQPVEVDITVNVIFRK